MASYLSRQALAGLRVVEIRGGLAASVAGRALTALGAAVSVVRLREQAERGEVEVGLAPGKQVVDASELDPRLAEADAVLLAGDYLDLRDAALLPAELRSRAPRAVLGYATPFGLTGPLREWRGGELVELHASGIARLLLGPVPDLDEFPPVKTYGDQGAFVGGLTLAAGVATALHGGGSHVVDVSIQEALASIAVHELARPALGETLTSRSGDATIGNATVMILPTTDGLVAVSPRETHQWDVWAEYMGSPAWALEPGMREVEKRQQRYTEVYPYLLAWSRQRTTDEVYRESQALHIPAFPLQPPGNLLGNEGLAERGFFIGAEAEGKPVTIPAHPFGLLDETPVPLAPREKVDPAGLPLEGLRVLDFSWVIAGPTCTRFLAAMGADVIKVEAPKRPDPARVGALHPVLGQGKRSLALDLKAPEGRQIALDLVRRSDVLVENFAAGVMDRLGLGWEELAEVNPKLIYISLSGMGRKGPDAGMVAYGTLVQAFSGFSAVNGFPNRQPTIGWAWTDPVCALVMTTAVAAALRQRDRTGNGCRVDTSMVETMLWTLSAPIVRHQLDGEPPRRQGNNDPRYFPHGVFPAAGEDTWLALAVTGQEQWETLCRIVPGLAGLERLSLAERQVRHGVILGAISAWSRGITWPEAAETLQAEGVPAAGSPTAAELFEDSHLRERNFYVETKAGERAARLPGVAWRLDGGRGKVLAPAASLSADAEALLAELGYDAGAVSQLRDAGVVG